MSSDPLDVLARTIWGEARGTGITGMKHVASVILNRAAHPRWWGHDVVSVCLKPYQFSCWNSKDPNLPKLSRVTVADRQFSDARYIASQALAGRLVDETGGADSYYALSSRNPPSWIAKATHTMSDGFHAFWRVELHAPEGQPQAPAPPAVSNPDTSADELNAEELRRQRDYDDTSADDLNAEELRKLRR
jgi:N-acetylmuramoyl-L-alanine amidase